MAQASLTPLLLTENMEMAQKLVRVLACWVADDQEAMGLAEICDVEAWILDGSPPGLN